MPRKQDQPDIIFDAIARERYFREKEEFVESLFHPIYWNGPEWKLDWVVQDLIPTGYLVLLAAPPKSGKTCFATALALSVANGLPFAGRPVQQGAVLWISAEESPRERQILLGKSPLVEPSTPLYTCYQRLPINEDRSLNALSEWISRTEARLLVVDPLIACVGHSLADSWAARSALQELKEYAERWKVTILALHHQKRDTQSYRRGRVADNAQLAATASMNIVLSHRSLDHHDCSPPLKEGLGVDTNDAPRLITLDCTGRGAFANRCLYLVSHGPLDYRPTQVEETAPLVENGRAAYVEERVLEALKDGPRGSNAIIAETHLKVGSVRNAITNLRRKGKVKMIDIGKNERIYTLCERPIESEAAEGTDDRTHDQTDD